MSNLNQLRSGLDPARVVDLARRIHRARRILVVGVDLAASLSGYLAYGLTPLGFDAEAPVGSSGVLRHKVRLLTPKDLVVAISFGRCLRDTVEAGKHAMGLSNHYYWWVLATEQGGPDKLTSKIYHFATVDPGNLVLSSGAGVLKSSKNAAEAQKFVAAFLPLVKDATAVEIAIAPPFTALSRVGEALAGSNVALAAQNVNPEPQGAYTGEVSALMLAELGCRYGIVGHSERRSLYREDDALISRKALALLERGIRPIVCVGETLDQREAGATFQVIGAQGAADGTHVFAHAKPLVPEPIGYRKVA